MRYIDPSVAGIVLGILIIIGLIVALAHPLERLEHKLAERTYGVSAADLVRNADGILVPADREARA